ncbi:probable helicase senataxin [Orussus abietinus]|uniref:probable helicase senataxin n=1 Tax=Orussus abietinus TaxID=222816 RepID=UPI000625D673|nr:probable helicase senataxin [Orussus abietinus]
MEGDCDDVDYMLKRMHNPGIIILGKNEESYSCGRGKDNKIICLSPWVSRQHCFFIRTKDGLSVIDLKSSNGVFVNGVMLKPNTMVKLKINDIVGIGCGTIDSAESSMFIYKLLESQSAVDDQPTNVSCGSRTIKGNDGTTICTTENNSDLNKRRLAQKNINAHLPSKISKLQPEESCSDAIIRSTNQHQDIVNGIVIKQAPDEMDDDIQILSHSYSATYKFKNWKAPCNNSKSLSLQNDNRLTLLHLARESNDQLQNENEVSQNKNEKQPCTSKESENCTFESAPIDTGSDTNCNGLLMDQEQEASNSEQEVCLLEEKKKSTFTSVSQSKKIHTHHLENEIEMSKDYKGANTLLEKNESITSESNAEEVNSGSMSSHKEIINDRELITVLKGKGSTTAKRILIDKENNTSDSTNRNDISKEHLQLKKTSNMDVTEESREGTNLGLNQMNSNTNSNSNLHPLNSGNDKNISNINLRSAESNNPIIQSTSLPTKDGTILMDENIMSKNSDLLLNAVCVDVNDALADLQKLKPTINRRRRAMQISKKCFSDNSSSHGNMEQSEAESLEYAKCTSEVNQSAMNASTKLVTDDNVEDMMSPIKLKQVKQEPMTRFSEIDVVNLSDDDDDIFPCSQLFDSAKDTGEELKQEIKEENVDSENDMFYNTYEPEEIILLSDSEDEENLWLERLSRSQILSEENDDKLVISEIERNSEKSGKVTPEQFANKSSRSVRSSIEETSVHSRSPDDNISDNNFKEHEQKKTVHEKSKEISETISEKPTEKEPMEVDGSESEKSLSEKESDSISSKLTKASLEDDRLLLSPRVIISKVDHKLIADKKYRSKKKKSEENSGSSNVIEGSLEDGKKKMDTTSKQYSNKKRKPEIIDAPYMPKGESRGVSCSIKKNVSDDVTSSISHSKKDGNLSPNRKVTKSKKSKKDTANVKLDKKEQKQRRISDTLIDFTPLPRPRTSSLSKEEKIELANSRKGKLKEIATEQKATEDIKLRTNRIPAKPRVKVSKKNRGDFLIKDLENQLDDPSERTEEFSNNYAPPEIPMIADESLETYGNYRVQRKYLRTYYRTQAEEETATISTGTSTSINSVADSIRKILNIQPNEKSENSPRPQTSVRAEEIQQKSNIRKNKQLENQQKSLTRQSDETSENQSKSFNHQAMEISESGGTNERFQGKSVLKQKENLSPNVTKEGKRKNVKKVSFSLELATVKIYEIDPQNTLKKVVGKDAPIPKEKMPVKEPIRPRHTLDEVLLRIFAWKPIWLEEQRHLKSEPPLVESNIPPMQTYYKSYEDYYRILMPLILLEIWQDITKEFTTIEMNPRRPTVMCSIVRNSVAQINIPITDLYATTMTLEVLVSKEDLQKQAHPVYGDLVFMEVVSTDNGKNFHKLFAYVVEQRQYALSPNVIYNQDLAYYVKKPEALLLITVMTKRLELSVNMNRVQRLRSIMYLRSNMRMIQALQFLPLSPLLDAILLPKTKSYQLPSVLSIKNYSPMTKEKLNPKQLEAVSRVTEAIIQKEPKICLIQGPPGTGKSKVIINIITQALYGDDRYKNGKNSLKILVCAPSNAAIDEIVLRLLAIRASIPKNRFKMVRIGHQDKMNPMVKVISVSELAKRDVAKRIASGIQTNNQEEERSLEARINALKAELQSSNKLTEERINYVRKRLVDTMARYDLLKHCPQMNEMNLRERARLERQSENTLLAGADIITCTLSSCYTNQMEQIFGGHREKISVCIVDEATQSCEAETLIPLMLGVKTLVLVGDPNQLPATVLSQRAKKLGLDQSLFSRIKDAFHHEKDNPIIMLDTQYRMAYPIAYWPNKFFYEGKLRNSAENYITNTEPYPFHSYKVLNLDSKQDDDKFSNTDEAQFVANLIYTMMIHARLEKINRISIGVITPYNNQRTIVENKINERITAVPDEIKKKITTEVNTVDSFQGQERDVIIMSCVRSRGIGFMSDRQRVCVALTRARHSLILCGNFKTFEKDIMWNALLTDARSRKVFINMNSEASPEEIKPHVVR